MSYRFWAFRPIKSGVFRANKKTVTVLTTVTVLPPFSGRALLDFAIDCACFPRRCRPRFHPYAPNWVFHHFPDDFRIGTDAVFMAFADFINNSLGVIAALEYDRVVLAPIGLSLRLPASPNSFVFRLLLRLLTSVDELARFHVESVGILAAAGAPLGADFVEFPTMSFNGKVGAFRRQIAVDIIDEGDEHVADRRALDGLDFVMDEAEGRLVEQVENVRGIFAGAVFLGGGAEEVEAFAGAIALGVDDGFKAAFEWRLGGGFIAEVEGLDGADFVADFAVAADDLVSGGAKAHFSLVHDA